MSQELKLWKEIEDKFGITAWEEVRNYLFRQDQKIKELTESRDSWKKKYMELNNRHLNKNKDK